MMISVNGPSQAQCDKVVMAAMKQHFKRQHGIRFVTRSNDISLFATVAQRYNASNTYRSTQTQEEIHKHK
jgi:hypothetical protein